LCNELEIPVQFVHEGFVPGTLSFDSQGEMAESSVAVNYEEFESLPLNSTDLKVVKPMLQLLRETSADRKTQYNKGMVSRVLQRYQGDFDKIIFFAGSNDWYTGMLPSFWKRSKTHSPSYVDGKDLLFDLVKYCESRNHLLVYKPHPNTNQPVPLKSKNRLTVRHSNSIECVECSDLVITLVSGISYLSMIHQKPTLLAGRNSLEASGSVYFLQRDWLLEEAVDEALEIGLPDHQQIAFERFFCRLMKYYLVPYSSPMGQFFGKSRGSFAEAIREMVACPGGGRSVMPGH
ncbi:MAG: hypothetical protein AAF202_13570, partial [Pseudomonadota bacterium]